MLELDNTEPSHQSPGEAVTLKPADFNAQCLVVRFIFSDASGYFPPPLNEALKIPGTGPGLINGHSFSWRTRHHPSLLSQAPRRRGGRGKPRSLPSSVLFPDHCGSVVLCVRFEVPCGSTGFRPLLGTSRQALLCSLSHWHFLAGESQPGFQNGSRTEHVITVLHV